MSNDNEQSGRSRPGSFAAQILDASAPAYAGLAAGLLVESHSEIAERYAPSALAHWKAHLTDRLRELSTALALDEAELFVARVQWTRQAFRAREVPEDDLRASLECLREVLADDLPEAAAREAEAILDRTLAAFDVPAPGQEAGLAPDHPLDRMALEYVTAALEGQSRRAIERVLAAVDDGLGVQEAYLRILLPAQREVGRLWHAGELSIAEEHLVTATTRQAMSFLLRHVQPAAPIGRTVIVAAVAGNVHDVAVRAVADLFELAGWRVICLGADVPAGELADAVRDFEADLLVLSATLGVQLRMVENTLAGLRAAPDLDVKVLVGGAAFDAAPDLWRRVGADGYSATLEGAVAAGTKLVAE